MSDPRPTRVLATSGGWADGAIRRHNARHIQHFRTVDSEPKAATHEVQLLHPGVRQEIPE